MSLTAKRLRRGRQAASAPIVSTAAIVGRTGNYQAGVGWRPLKEARENNFVGMLVSNAVLISLSNGEGVAVMPDRSVQCWGQNGGSNLPWTVGPEGLWSGEWGYRTNLVPQTELEGEGFTRPQIEAKERSFAIRIPGQLVYGVGAIVIAEGGTWEALKENCAVKPGTDPTVWVPASPQVQQFEHTRIDGTEDFLTYAYNLAAPRVAPQLDNVVAVNSRGAHGIILLADGTVRMWGHVIRYGNGGSGMDQSYGPKPRPLQSPRTRKFPFTGTLTAGSAVITKLEQIGELHHKSTGDLSPYGPFTRVGTLILMRDAFGRLVGAASTHTFTLTAHGMANGTACQLSGLGGGAGLSEGVTYYVVERTTNTFQLSGTKGGTVVAFTSDVTAGTVTTLGLLPEVSVVSTTSHEVLDEEGHSYVPERRELDTITVSEPAAYDYVGKLAGKKAPAEEKFWNIGEGSRQSAGWPVTPKLPAGVKVVAVSTAVTGGSANTYSLALTDTGEVLAWGSNVEGWQGDLGAMGETHYNLFPAYVKEEGGANLKNIVAIACNENVCMALDSSHRVWIWGDTSKGQAGKAPSEAGTNKTSTPLLMADLPTTVGERPVAIACVTKACVAILENGQLVAWGGNESGQLGRGFVSTKSAAGFPLPERVGTLANIKYVYGGRNHFAAVDTAGVLYTWGSNDSGQLGNGESGKGGGPKFLGTVQVPDLKGHQALSVTCGEFNTLVCLDGSSALPNRVKVTLVPQGEVTGEPSAYIKLRWESAVTTGWRFSYRREATWQEELLREQLKQELELLLEEGSELTAEEREQAEEELELLETEEAEAEAAAIKIEITPTEVSPGVWEYEWISPGRLTPNSGYIVSILNPTHEPAPWNQAQVHTNGLWGSPYVL